MTINKSMAAQEHAKKTIPGMTQLLSKRPDLFSYGVWPGYYSKAKGAKVWDLDGNEYLDMSIAGIGANVLGYADDEIDDAVCSAIRKGVSSTLNCPEELELADLLCEIHPWAKMVRYTRSGGEAMTLAVRIARAHTKRSVVAFCGYHGWHDWYLAANVGTDNALGEHLIPGLEPAGVPVELAGTALPFYVNDLESLKNIAEKSKDKLAAIVMEPVRNIYPTPEFLAAVQKLAKDTGAVLIVDEISAGLRINTGGAHLTFDNFTPDIAVFSKALGNGYAISAVIGNADVMQSAQKTFISSTNWTEKVGPTAALATLRKHARVNAGVRLVELGRTVQAGWSKLAEKHGLSLHVGGLEPLSHFSFDENPLETKAYFIQLMLDKGFLASNLYYAMFAHSDADVESYLHACDQAFKTISETKDIKAVLRGAPSGAGFKRIS
ncbi:aminotransferase class III-fold pyridoxal phosphate-dependent enzyme [Desulfovibrio litoralis]|uniref:Glutamate-1-semialdehyde 2,1-aminomutase n=1 Tax=Desulfovibrio litoralis DSM 11393 TaxID=1121455 RepID=A0A1M7RRA7_9BACT|nr:aminotransferase class III-fold pyridoxal phosphate-dependent enzyme [Desulfovibrio litoralis]SHN48636.1 glutamate-1-semialdehyde 2,1-aminomutase [Desulfovibrio litoralis DSM 11393]